MTVFFSKPIEKLESSDIESLIGTPESQVFEIKQALPNPDGSDDPWLVPPVKEGNRNGPSDYARQAIFREVVAFANADGGWLVIGLSETDDNPKRAKEVIPLPDCVDLAAALERAAYDWIDPPIPGLRCRGIELNNRHGVVVFRLPRSSIAPHRLYKSKKTQEAYRRVNDESKPMRMRELQDMVLSRSRGFDKLESEFSGAKERYLGFRPFNNTAYVNLMGFRITLVPAYANIVLERPYLQEDLYIRKPRIRFLSQSHQPQLLNYRSMSGHTSPIKPLLRGGIQSWVSFSGNASNQDFGFIEIYESGVINIVTKTTIVDHESDCIGIDNVVAELSNALCIAKSVCDISNSPETDYVLEIEIRNDLYDRGKLIQSEGVAPFSGFQLLGISYFSKITYPLMLPRYNVNSQSILEGTIVSVIDDIYNAAGQKHIENLKLVISSE